MKLPNGYGSVYKLSGNRRKKFGVRVTVGWSKDKKQIYKSLGYFEKRQDAINALAEYNKNPYDLNSRQITFEELYERWSKERFPDISKSTIAGYTSSYKRCESLHKMKIVDIHKEHLQELLDNSGLAYATQKLLKNFHNQMFKYAMEENIVMKNPSSSTKIRAPKEASKRAVFTPSEISILFNHQDVGVAKTVLILIFTGMRINELLDMKKSNVNLAEKYMIGGSKTEAGMNRTIPIADKILPIVEEFMQTEGDYLINAKKGGKMGYVNFKNHNWGYTMDTLKMSHTPHDTRHTFITLMDEAEVNPNVIKKIVGHSSKDITDRYTHKNLQQMLEAVNKI